MRAVGAVWETGAARYSVERWARRLVHGSGGVHSHCDEAAFVRSRADLAKAYAVTASGAGLANWGTATIAQRALINNFTTGTPASAQGGGIQRAGVLSMANTTVSGNCAGGNYGGGIHLIPSATSLALVNVTLTDHESGNFGDGLGIGGAAVPVTMVNSIAANNRVRGVAALHDCSGTVTSEGYNLIGVSTGCTMAGDLTGVLSRAGAAQGKELRRNSLEASCHPRRRRVTAASAGDTAACSYLAG
jgi:hypothetical protein